MFLRYRVSWPSIDIQVKFYRDRPRGTPPLGELHRRGVVMGWRLGVVVSVVGRINEVNQHRARLVYDG